MKNLGYPNKTDHSVLDEIGAPAPELLLVLARLLLFTRVIVKAPSFYISLLHNTEDVFIGLPIVINCLKDLFSSKISYLSFL